MVKGVGEGDIKEDIEFEGKTMRICLTQVMHVPGTDGKSYPYRNWTRTVFKSTSLEATFVS